MNLEEETKKIREKVGEDCGIGGKIKFDFNNVDLIGPAFADELIRGLNKKKETIEIQWINSNDMIDIMMSHAVERFS